MRIFVTGATGYLGFHFVNVAVEQGHEVLCMRRPTSISLFDPIIEGQIRWVNNDDETMLREIVNVFRPDVLFHAAWGGVRGQGRNDDAIQQDNIEMSKRVISLYPYKQIIALGSQAEYGYYENAVKETHPLNPLTPYGKAKGIVCDFLKSYCEQYNMEWQWIRIFTVFGEKQTGGLIKLFSERCLSGDADFDTTEGEQRYSYLYSYDFAQALCMVLGFKGKSGIYNLSQPKDIVSNRKLLEKIKNYLGSSITIHFGAKSYEPNQVMIMDGEVKNFENAFGQVPHTDFDEALGRTIDSVKATFVMK